MVAMTLFAALVSLQGLSRVSAADGEVVVRRIQPEIVDETLERVCMQFSDYSLPKVKALPGDNPRVFADIENAAPWRGPSEFSVGGRFILKVRVHWHGENRSLRVVLDLNPVRDYTIDQAFYVAGNIFCLKVSGGGR